MNHWKPTGLLLLLLIVIFSIMLIVLPIGKIQAESPTATLRAESVFITVTYIEPINVRGGPNSVYYPIVGTLPIGAVAPALGRSLAGEWIKIAFPEASDGSGVGWVYANLVTLSPGVLHVVEPPPTVMPSFFITLNPAYAVSLQPEPTSTRMATFTAPAPLSIPTYSNRISEDRNFSSGGLIIILLAVGLIGLLLSSRQSKRY